MSETAKKYKERFQVWLDSLSAERRVDLQNYMITNSCHSALECLDRLLKDAKQQGKVSEPENVPCKCKTLECKWFGGINFNTRPFTPRCLNRNPYIDKRGLTLENGDICFQVQNEEKMQLEELMNTLKIRSISIPEEELRKRKTLNSELLLLARGLSLAESTVSEKDLDIEHLNGEIRRIKAENERSEKSSQSAFRRHNEELKTQKTALETRVSEMENSAR